MSEEVIYYPMSRFVNNTGTGRVYCTLSARILREPRADTTGASGGSSGVSGDNGMIIACGNIQPISSEGSTDTRDVDVVRSPHLYSCKLAAPSVCGVSVLETAASRVFSLPKDSLVLKNYRGDLGFCDVLLLGCVLHLVIHVFNRTPEQGKLTAVTSIVNSIIGGVAQKLREHGHELKISTKDFEVDAFPTSVPRFRALVRELAGMVQRGEITADFRDGVLHELMRARIKQLDMLFPRFAFYLPPPVDYLHTGFVDSSARFVRDSLKIAQGSIGFPRELKHDICRALPISVPAFQMIMNNLGHRPAPPALFGASSVHTMGPCAYATIMSLHVAGDEQMYCTECTTPSDNNFLPRLYHTEPSIAGIVKHRRSTFMNEKQQGISSGGAIELQRVTMIMCDLFGIGGRVMLEMLDLITKTKNKKFAFMNYAIPELPATRPAILSDILPKSDSKLVYGYPNEPPILVLYIGTYSK